MSDQLHRLLAIMATLRDPQNGCEWDRAQRFETIVPHTIEEAYEIADAVARGDIEDIRDELGDLLFQVVFQARIAEEAGQFDFDAVARSISDKLKARHPHIFAEADAPGADRDARWEAIKAAERLRRKFSRLYREVDLPEEQTAASIGVADYPSCATDNNSLIAAADAALLFAKRHGRDRVAYFRDITEVEQVAKT